MNDSQTNISSLPSIVIDDQPISWPEVFACMQLFGKLKPFLQEFIGQYVIIQEIKSRQDLEVDSAQLMQEIMDFRLKKQLSDKDKFQDWLKSENLDNNTFQQRIALELKVKQLREKITAPDIESYFKEHQQSFEQLKMSCLLVSDEDLARQLKERITTEDNDLLQLANEYTSADNGYTVRFSKQQVQRRTIAGEAAKDLALASVGDTVGPLKVAEEWIIFHLEEIITPELDENLKSQIEAQLFSQWLVNKLRDVKIGFNNHSD